MAADWLKDQLQKEFVTLSISNFLVADNQIGHIYVNMDKKVVIVSIFRYHLAHLPHMKKKEDKKCIICSFKKGQYF
jgi:hypothetical protein